jgi:hypothetical protein
LLLLSTNVGADPVALSFEVVGPPPPSAAAANVGIEGGAGSSSPSLHAVGALVVSFKAVRQNLFE